MQEPLTASMLPTALPTEQKKIIGERLFMMVQKFQPTLAGKITGMLLETDNVNLLNMLEQQGVLKENIEEMVKLLQAYQAYHSTSKVKEKR